MRTVQGTNYYSPREIADSGKITNSKGKPDYGFVLRLIKRGTLKAAIFNEESQTPYYLVEEREIAKYNSKFEITKFN